MIAYRMWHGVINYNQKPRFASCSLDEVIKYADKELEGICTKKVATLPIELYREVLIICLR